MQRILATKKNINETFHNKFMRQQGAVCFMFKNKQTYAYYKETNKHQNKLQETKQEREDLSISQLLVNRII